jgi:hypothetical protein
LKKLRETFKKRECVIKSPEQLFEYMTKADIMPALVFSRCKVARIPHFEKELENVKPQLREALFYKNEFTALVINEYYSLFDSEQAGYLNWRQLLIGIYSITKGSSHSCNLILETLSNTLQ